MFFFFFFKHLFKKSIGGLLHYDWPTKCRPCWNEITSNWNRRNAQWKRSQKRSVDQQNSPRSFFVHSAVVCPVLCCALRPTRQDLPLSSCQGVSWSCLGPNSQKWLPLLPRSPLSTAWIKSQLGFVQFSTLIGHWGALWVLRYQSVMGSDPVCWFIVTAA